MASQKPLMVLPTANMANLHTGPATGMGFYLFESGIGFFAALDDGAALPLFLHVQYYSLDDLLNGDPVPAQRSTAPPVNIISVFPSRFRASATVLKISPKYVPYTHGAIPLVASFTLPIDTVFFRYVSSIPDHRYSGGQLRAGTYLTSDLDTQHANTGFGAVGRFALPLPVPISHVIEYEIPAGTLIEVGTVSPLYGQSGGGVEIHLPNATGAKAVATKALPPF